MAMMRRLEVEKQECEEGRRRGREEEEGVKEEKERLVLRVKELEHEVTTLRSVFSPQDTKVVLQKAFFVFTFRF